MNLPRTGLFALFVVLSACGESPGDVSSWRVRTEVTAELNDDHGWGAPAGGAVQVEVDREFRIRFAVERDRTGPAQLRLEARRNGGDWMPMEALDHPYPDEIASSVTSIVATEAWSHGEPAEPLISPGTDSFAGGSGISLRPSPLLRSLSAGTSEWEWPLVIRYFSDGAVRVEEGDRFEYRLVDWTGTPLGGPPAAVTVHVPDGHMGGTFVETPGRIGPFQASNGDLYFLQEPAETWNVFMVVKSEDQGRSWVEVDGANRPAAGDLEAVEAVLVDDVLHILHQSDSTWYHTFGTSDHSDTPDRWITTDEGVGAELDPPTQVTSLAARSDGSLVAMYGGNVKLRYRIRSPEGDWSPERVVDADTPDTLSAPTLVTGADDTVHLVYVDLGGTAWIRSILADGGLTPRTRIATGLGTAEVDRVGVLPLARLASGAVSIVWHPQDGGLLERRLGSDGTLGATRIVTEVGVASGPVDSHQVTADLIAVEDDTHVLFVEAETGSLWHTLRPAGGEWSAPRRVMDGIEVQWVRGAALGAGTDRPAGDASGDPAAGSANGRIYGFVIDTGSYGGSGMNRYHSIPPG